jgi:hypothetical protein
MSRTFVAAILHGKGKDTMGIVVPPEVVESLGAGKRPPVTVRLGKGGYTYRSTIASMGGQFLIGIAKEHREPAGISNQKTMKVTLTLDTQPRDATLPKDLAAALLAAGVRRAFDKLAPSRRKEAVRQVESAKAQETRERRILKIVAELGNAAK